MQSKESASWYRRLWPFKKKSKTQQKWKKTGISACVRLVIRPLRIFQFLVVLLIFVLIIYTIMLADSKLSSVTCILIIVLSGVYVFVLAIDIISQFSGGELHTIPMFLFSLLGTIFFAVAGILLLFTYSSPWYILTIACLSLLAFVLFVIEVSLILAFWKRTCNICQQCCYSKQTEVLFQKDYCDPVCTETVKHDLMTSVSSVRIPSGDEDAIPDHSYRKVGYGHRRQYVDCPTSARSLAFVNVANVQTERSPTSNTHSQTQRQVKEIPVQTVSRCELCNRKIQPFSSSTAVMQPTAQQAQCAPCPALVQLFRGTPCCPGCRCVTGIIQVSQQSQQQQTQRQDQSKQDKEAAKEQKSYDMLTSDQCQPQDPKLTGVSGTITKLTLASYCVAPKKTSTSSQTGDAARTMKKSEEPEEAKRTKLSSLKKEKEREKRDARKPSEIITPEKEKTKATDNATKKSSIVKPAPKKIPESTPIISAKPARKEISEPPAEKREEPLKKQESEVPAEEPEGSIAQETPEAAAEDAETGVKQSVDSIHQTLANIEPKKLISPPRQVAEMIDRLQEIEGTKSDAPLKGSTSDPVVEASTKKETKPSIVYTPDRKQTVTISTPVMQESSKELTRKGDEQRKLKDTRNVAGDKGKSRKNAATYDTISISKMRVLRSDSDSSMMTNDDSEVSVPRKEKDSGEAANKSKVSDRTRRDSTPATKTERSLETESIVKPHVETQTIKRTYGYRKKNKVEPAELTHTDMDIQTMDYNETYTPTSKMKTEKLFAEGRESFEEKPLNICPACKRLQTPVASSSFQYYNVHRDKRGRLFCDYCATSNTIKVLYKKDIDQKRLKCSGCGNFLRMKSNHSARNKSDNCPNCGQMQIRTQSVVSA